MVPSKISLVSFFAGVCFNVFIFFLLLSVYFGANPLNHSRALHVNFVSIFPQGWAFFTKSSKDPQLYLFSYNKGKFRPINLRNFSAEYDFGLSRHNRILNVEIHHIFRKIKEDSIQGYEIKAISPDKIPEVILKNKKVKYENIAIKKELTPDLNGKYLLALQFQLPWALLHRKSDYPLHYNVYPIEMIQ